jgi:hypothetical protein
MSRLGAAVVEGPREAVVEGARVACFVVVLRSGLHASWPIGSLGEVGIETP